MKRVIVVPYDASWKTEFEKIKEELLYALGKLAMAIEHVGSTAVEELAAKPIIDIDVVMQNYNDFEMVKDALGRIGYTHEGDLGIKDRQAFKYADKSHLHKHHLYVCPAYSKELKRHLSFRDYLRRNPTDRDWYASVKIMAAQQHPEDIEGYIAAKSPCIEEIYRKCMTVL